MAKFVYADTLIVEGTEHSYDVCYPIETDMNLDDLIAFLQLKAEAFKKENPKTDIFYPFGGDYYQMSVTSLLSDIGLGYCALLIPIEDWKGVNTSETPKW